MRGVWCVAIVALGIAQAQEQQPGRGVNFFSKEKEIALGQQLAAESRKNATPLDNPIVNDYVSRVGGKLATQFPEWTYRFEAMRGNTGGATHEPAAFPGGIIFVSADLIAAARNEAEFAGMLAHAMAHVAARHATRLAARTQVAQIGAQAAAATAPADGAGVGIPLRLLSFQRANETEADYLAVQAMATAGYDPNGLASYVERVQPPRGSVDRVFADMPDRDERVKAIQTEIGKLPAGTYEASGEFARVQAEVRAR
jgi:predicted Zn-dependent protease